MIEPVHRYPPPPYPRMPRERVGDGICFHEATDDELRQMGLDPADYMPPSRTLAAPPATGYTRRHFAADAIGYLSYFAVALWVLHHTAHQLTTLELFGCFWIGGLVDGFVVRFLKSAMGISKMNYADALLDKPAPAAPATV